MFFILLHVISRSKIQSGKAVNGFCRRFIPEQFNGLSITENLFARNTYLRISHQPAILYFDWVFLLKVVPCVEMFCFRRMYATKAWFCTHWHILFLIGLDVIYKRFQNGNVEGIWKIIKCLIKVDFLLLSCKCCLLSAEVLLLFDSCWVVSLFNANKMFVSGEFLLLQYSLKLCFPHLWSSIKLGFLQTHPCCVLCVLLNLLSGVM